MYTLMINALNLDGFLYWISGGIIYFITWIKKELPGISEKIYIYKNKNTHGDGTSEIFFETE